MNTPKTRNAEIVVQEMEKEILIYDLKENKAFCLNETSALIYQLCDGTKTTQEIADAISVKLKTLVSEDFVWLALDSFKKDNLLEENERFAIDFNGLSRRQVIKKIGFASMVALPVIASVIAPSAAMAQSGAVAFLGACNDPTGSQSNCAPGLRCRSCNQGGGDACAGPNICCMGGGGLVPNGGFCSFATCSNSALAVCCSGSAVDAPTTPSCSGLGGIDCRCT